MRIHEIPNAREEIKSIVVKLISERNMENDIEHVNIKEVSSLRKDRTSNNWEDEKYFLVKIILRSGLYFITHFSIKNEWTFVFRNNDPIEEVEKQIGPMFDAAGGNEKVSEQMKKISNNECVYY